MSKTKTPFFGLDARGTVGGSITAQRLPKGTLLRTKPLPTYRYTLPQAYQRWLYEDYAYLWRQQTPAVQAQHRTAGVPYHLTGFQYWMKYNLTNLPDIAAWWKLDDNLGTTVLDSSRNENTGTIIGASPADGLIDRALYFDGLNDRITVPYSPSIDLGSAFTLECLVYSTNFARKGALIEKTIGGIVNTQFALFLHTTPPFFRVTEGAVLHTARGDAVPSNNTWHHLCGRYDSTITELFIDGVLQAVSAAATGPANTGVGILKMGELIGGDYDLDATLDNVILYNRALDATEILRHSLRRYPA